MTKYSSVRGLGLDGRNMVFYFKCSKFSLLNKYFIMGNKKNRPFWEGKGLSRSPKKSYSWGPFLLSHSRLWWLQQPQWWGKRQQQTTDMEQIPFGCSEGVWLWQPPWPGFRLMILGYPWSSIIGPWGLCDCRASCPGNGFPSLTHGRMSSSTILPVKTCAEGGCLFHPPFVGLFCLRQKCPYSLGAGKP